MGVASDERELPNPGTPDDNVIENKAIDANLNVSKGTCTLGLSGTDGVHAIDFVEFEQQERSQSTVSHISWHVAHLLVSVSDSTHTCSPSLLVQRDKATYTMPAAKALPRVTISLLMLMPCGGQQQHNKHAVVVFVASACGFKAAQLNVTNLYFASEAQLTSRVDIITAACLAIPGRRNAQVKPGSSRASRCGGSYCCLKEKGRRE
jgi:hypothetical protein